MISAPVFDAAGNVVLALTLFDFPKPDASGGVDLYIAQVVEAATSATAALGGAAPAS